MRVLIVLVSVIALAFVLALWPRRAQIEQNGALDAPAHAAQARVRVRPPPPAISGSNAPNAVSNSAPSAILPTTAPVKVASDYLFDRKRYHTDMAYAAKIQKHMAIKRYLESPARETDEAYSVFHLVTKEGLGRDSIADAYNLAFEVNKIVTMVEKQPGLTAQQQADRITLLMLGIPAQLEERFTQKFPLKNPPEFFQELYKIRPTVFFGQKNYNLPEEGEPLLE